jgi:16S rRNA (uracil1498-N3)-methyltransferase
LQQVKNFISNYKIVYLLDYEAETKLANQTIDEEVLFIVGPEGGLTDDEKAQFMQGGAKSINIGTSVLRGSTAGAVATALATNLR